MRSSRRAWSLSLAKVTALSLALLGSTEALAQTAVNHVQKVSVQNTAEGTDVTVEGTAPPRFSARVANGGKRLIIDLADADLATAIPALTQQTGVLGGLVVQGYQSDGGKTARIYLQLTETSSYRIRPEQNRLRIVLNPAPTTTATSTAASSRASSAPATPAATATGPIEIKKVNYRHGTSSDQVSVVVSGTPSYSQTSPRAGVSRLVVRSASLAEGLERTLDMGAFNGLVRTVSTYRGTGSSTGSVVIDVERADDAAGNVTFEGGTLTWTFARPGSLPSTVTGVGADGGVARRTRTVAREDAMEGIPKVEATVDPEESETAVAESGAFLPGTQLAQKKEKVYQGRRIDLDLKDADIHNVLRLLADVGQVNIITADNVSGSVTIRMRNVPWDRALETVLQSKSLGMVRQGNVVRVAPLAELEKEREMAIARRKQEYQLTPVETRLIPVSYANATDIQARSKDLLSPRGSIAVDDRTNVLIVRDVAGNLNQIEELVRSLDTQTPQVLVEARIVEASSRYLRDVGIQWGGDTTFSAATGNPTGLAFPSSVVMAGGATDTNTPTAGMSPFARSVANPNFAVNLPATVGAGQGGALGITLGSINNTLNLGVRLSAAETSGMVRIISSPRVLTLDNHEASISQGTLIPFSQISAMGVQTTFREAKLQLLVRPHVTAEGSVAMHVKVNRDEPDFTQTSARGDPTILKREAETDLLVMDGHTAVIGGIFTRNTGRNLDQVPFFGDIPLIGLLFQRRRASDNRGELVIFITPRIVNRAEALGR
ncbi:MAG: type IV pilus secretin PilQ [Deltaproteobacteria bacterium]|nr:type IV pilus secretin PilQ [Deltaproteobacteria bacterium]